MTREEFLKLYESYLRDECSDEDLRKLFAYEDDFEMSLKPWNDPIMGEKEEVRWKILQRIAIKSPSKNNVLWKVGLSVFTVIIIGFIVFFKSKREDIQPSIVQNEMDEMVEDVLPGSDKAILILADGSSIILDSAKNGLQIDQKSTTVIYENGQLRYESEPDATIVYNAIAIPKGGQYKLKLSDGTNVWLNADSYFRFPTRFPGDIREVELRGEGFFDVVSSEEKPFIVKVLNDDIEDTKVTVTGTSFNINSYDNENTQAITLIEGKLLVSSKNHTNELKEGETLLVGDQIRLKKLNTEVITAWKENRFEFENESLGSILRQIERWYDVEIVYENNIIPNEKYYGIVSREVLLSQVLKMLELSSDIKFEIKDKQLLVK